MDGDRSKFLCISFLYTKRGLAIGQFFLAKIRIFLTRRIDHNVYSCYTGFTNFEKRAHEGGGRQTWESQQCGSLACPSHGVDGQPSESQQCGSVDCPSACRRVSMGMQQCMPLNTHLPVSGYTWIRSNVGPCVPINIGKSGHTWSRSNVAPRVSTVPTVSLGLSGDTWGCSNVSPRVSTVSQTKQKQR